MMAGLGVRFELPGGANFLLRYERDILDRISGGVAMARISKGFQAGVFRLAPQLQVNWLSADVTNYDFGVPAGADDRMIKGFAAITYVF
jgi:outer membrane protein